jgi:hypothetical protein
VAWQIEDHLTAEIPSQRFAPVLRICRRQMPGDPEQRKMAVQGVAYLSYREFNWSPPAIRVLTCKITKPFGEVESRVLLDAVENTLSQLQQGTATGGIEDLCTVLKDGEMGVTWLRRALKEVGTPTEGPGNGGEIHLILGQDLEDLPEVEWRVDGMLLDGSRAVVYGAPGTGKSFWAIDLGLSIATGVPFHGFGVRQGYVVYVVAEGVRGFKKRQKAWLIDHRRERLPDSWWVYPRAIQLHKPEEVRQLVEALKRLPERPALIVFDTLARCFVGGEENSAKELGMLLAGVEELVTDTTSLLIVHHPGKDGNLRGSSNLPGHVDTLIKITREPDSAAETGGA